MNRSGRQRRVARGIACLVVTAMATPSLAADERHIARRVAAGGEALIRGFAEFDGACRLRGVPTIAIVDAPAHGRVETRPGTVVIGDNWVGDRTCSGTELEGVQVYYVAQAGYAGPDRFRIDVEYRNHRKVRAAVDVEVAP